MMRRVGSLVHAWLVLDFFGDARRSGAASSTLTTSIFTQSFLALVFAALLYPDTPVVPFVAANLSLSSLLVAVGLLDPEVGASRRQADRVLLASAPIGPATVLLARSSHAAFYIGLVTIGMALPPAVLLGFLIGDALRALAYVALAVVCSGLTAGALAVVARAAGRVLGQAKTALIAGTIKAMLLGGGLVLFALGLQRLQQRAEDLPIGRLGAELLPAYQAARWLADPGGEAWRLGALAGAGLALLALALWLGDREPSGAGRVSGRTPLRRLLQRLEPRGPGLGIADFVAVTMWRSPGFRSRALPLLGLPAGMAVLSLPGRGDAHGFVFTCLLLQLPAIYLPFLVAFLPQADQPEAGWLFAQAPALPPATLRGATWRALVTHVLLPVHTIALALLVLVQPGPDAVAAVAFAFAVAVLASRWMVGMLTTVPFTVDGAAQAGPDLGMLFAAALVLGGTGTAFGGLLPPGGRWVVAAVAVVAAIWVLRRPIADRVAAAKPSGTQAAGGPEPEAAEAAALDTGSAPARPPASLARELWAIAVLYGAVCLLPALIGTVFAA
ncbi:MAG: hypothetical protein KF830_18550 [Planctomycetes bacterium]|nr:hypothetical protein [Planctomycetota bacterium]